MPTVRPRASLPVAAETPEMVAEAMADLAWVRAQWSKSQWVDPELGSTAIAGHSFGAVLATRVAAAHPAFLAFVSLSGGFRRLVDALAALEAVKAVKAPSFIIWSEIFGTPLIEDLE